MFCSRVFNLFCLSYRLPEFFDRSSLIQLFTCIFIRVQHRSCSNKNAASDIHPVFRPYVYPDIRLTELCRNFYIGMRKNQRYYNADTM